MLPPAGNIWYWTLGVTDLTQDILYIYICCCFILFFTQFKPWNSCGWFFFIFFYSFAEDSLFPFPTLQSFWSFLASKQPQFKLIKQFGYTGTASPYSKNSLLIFAIKYYLYLKNQTLIDFLFFQKQTNKQQLSSNYAARQNLVKLDVKKQDFNLWRNLNNLYHY